MSVRVHTVSNRSLGRSRLLTFTTEYPLSIQLSIDALVSIPIDDEDGHPFLLTSMFAAAN